jgi:hypothetical protein
VRGLAEYRSFVSAFGLGPAAKSVLSLRSLHVEPSVHGVANPRPLFMVIAGPSAYARPCKWRALDLMPGR